MNKSVFRAVQILELISKNEKPLGISEISRLLDIPKSSTFDIIYTLVDTGFLEIEDERLKTFSIGGKMLSIGSTFLKKRDLIQTIRPYLEEMSKKTQDIAFLGVENNGEIIYIDKVESLSQGIKATATLGSTNPMSITGLGKSILATYPSEKVKEIVGDDPLIAKTEYSIDNFDDLIKELEDTRKRGYAIDIRESQEEICCVAAPINNYLEEPIAAISIASLAYKTNDKRQKELGKFIEQIALDISLKFGYIKDRLY